MTALDKIITSARREGFGYGVACGSITVTVMRRLLDWLWP